MTLVLGIDLGTTNVKTVVLNTTSREIVAETNQPHNASVENIPSGHHEQNVYKIFEALELCIQKLKTCHANYLSSICKIAVTGQMHGLVRWNVHSDVQSDLSRWQCSNLITWMDQRASGQFLGKFPRSDCGIHSGYGMASLLWLQKHERTSFQYCGTVMDLLVAWLTHAVRPVMSYQNAASFGYFSMVRNEWQYETLETLNISRTILPDLLPPGTSAGVLPRPWFTIPQGTQVFTALGDFQSTVFAQLQPNSAILNLGTSAQLSFQLPSDFKLSEELSKSIQTFQYFPYFERGLLQVAASLNGGNVLSSFVGVIRSWYRTLVGVEIENDQIWTKIEELLISDQENSQGLLIHPTIFAERHDSALTGSVAGITAENCADLKLVLHSLIEGIVANLNEMLPHDILQANGVKKILCTGQARKPWFSRVISKIYGENFEIVITDKEFDAAYGAALFVAQL